MSKRSFIIWIILCFSIGWGTILLMYLNNVNFDSFIGKALISTLFMFSPSISTFIVSKICNKHFNLKNVIFNFSFKKYLKVHLIFLLLIISNYLYIYLFGNLLDIKIFGKLNFSYDYFIKGINVKELEDLRSESFSKFIPFIILAISLTFGPFISGFINSIFTIGEEIGWRGYLFSKFQNLQKYKSSIIVGLIWGIWHAPLIILGLNFPEYPVLGILLMIISCISISFIFYYLRETTSSVFSCALLHGMINASSGFSGIFIENQNYLLSNFVGVSGTLGILTLILIFRKRIFYPIHNNSYRKWF